MISSACREAAAAELVGGALGAHQGAAHRLLGLAVAGELGLELVDAVVEVGPLAPDDLVGVGRALEQMVDIGLAVAEGPHPRPLVAELDR